jgi:hypothetical protein
MRVHDRHRHIPLVGVALGKDGCGDLLGHFDRDVGAVLRTWRLGSLCRSNRREENAENLHDSLERRHESSLG